MSVIELRSHQGYLVLDNEECRIQGSALKSTYINAAPFPHIVLDDFIDVTVLREVVSEFPRVEDMEYYDRSQERLKYQYGPEHWTGAVTNNLFALFNSSPFVTFLEAMTGIDGLIPDPAFYGGGLHETKVGGHLGIHADFNVHKKLGLLRRLNLLIYLNDDWLPEYGGNLELWDKEMKTCEVTVPPEMGRAVVFNTALDSHHGHPDPLTCPPDRSRRSMALYYYTSPREGLADVPMRTTQFQVRPGSADRTDWTVKRRHLLDDWMPPAARRQLHRLRGHPVDG